MTITRDLPASDYHAIKALSAGMVWTMDSECPLKAWLASPWNDKREAENAAHFDIGTAAHLAVLEPALLADRVVCHGFDDYRSAAAKTSRDDAWATGKTPLKPAEWEVVCGVREAIERNPVARPLFRNGDPEVTLQWNWDGVACKCRPDFLAADRRYVVDLKTATSANPRLIGRKACTEGWHVRAAWYLGGVKAATGILPDDYLFVVTESKAPFITEIYRLDQSALLHGEQIIMRSLKRFALCMENGWPGYSDGEIATIKLPTWEQFAHAEREEAGEFDVV